MADLITFVEGDFLKPLAQHPVDLIISNPPYVPSTELGLPRSVETAGLDFEPRSALDGGPDGLAFVDTIKQQPVPAVYESLGGTIYRHQC